MMDACDACATAYIEPAVTDLDIDQVDETPSLDLLPRKLMPAKRRPHPFRLDRRATPSVATPSF